VTVFVAILAAWKEQRVSALGPWPAIAAGSAYLATVFLLIAFTVNSAAPTMASGTGFDVPDVPSPLQAVPLAGVAAANPDGRFCVAMGRPLMPGTALTLIQPSRPQSSMVVTVGEAAVSCERLAGALIAAPYYLIASSEEAAPNAMSPWVAFHAPAEARRISADAVAVRLGGGGPDVDVQVRSCASREGLHLTVWAGVPLANERLWHQYYYLGYDLEPTCDELETAAGK
jgi:hypothetical protein